MRDYKEEAKVALSVIGSVNSISDSWPETIEDLSAIVVELASEMPVDIYDGAVYSVEIELYVRIFAATPSQIHSIHEEVKPIMSGLKYLLVHRFDQNTESAKQMIAIYRKIVSND